MSQTLSGCLGSIAISAVLDRFVGKIKLTATVLMAAATLGFALFAACLVGALDGILPGAHGDALRIAVPAAIFGGFCFNCTIPLFFELTMETVFGWAADADAAAVIVLFNTVVQISVLAFPVDSFGSKDWLTFALVGSFATATALLCASSIEYSRSETDMRAAAARVAAGAGGENGGEAPGAGGGGEQGIACSFDRSGCF